MDETEFQRMANSPDVQERRTAAEQLDKFASMYKGGGWEEDLHRLTQDEDSFVRWRAAGVLGTCFSAVSDKDTAWYDLHRLTQDENSGVRERAAGVLGTCFSAVSDKDTAWYDLHRLTQDEDSDVRGRATRALGTCFSAVSDKDTVWYDLHRLTQDEDSDVRMYAYHSLGSASVYKATETGDEEKFRDELKKAIDYFEQSSSEAKGRYYNPARFCLPFYRSYYAVILEKHDAEAETAKYLDEAKEATGGSESREVLLKAVENLANALKEAQKPDFSERQEHLKACRQHCDHTAELADSAREKSPVAAAAIERGISIVGVKIKEIIAEIQKKAEALCKQAQGTPTEGIACAVNQEVQKWRIDDQEEMTQKVDNLVFCLKSKIPQLPQNKHIHEKIEKIRVESNMAKQYELVSLLIALIPTASIQAGGIITNSGDNNIEKIDGAEKVAAIIKRVPEDSNDKGHVPFGLTCDKPIDYLDNLPKNEGTTMLGFKNGYGLIIGIANYTNVAKLSDIVLKDAQDINDLLLTPMYCGYHQANTRLLLDDKATADGIRQGLRWLAESAGPNDTVFLYFTGHGGRVEDGLEQGNYLIPYYGDFENLGSTAISGEELTDLLRNIKSQRFLALFDCCYSGGTGDVKGLASGFEFKSGFKDDYYNLLSKGKGRVIMASSRDDEDSLILPGMENSLFTHYLLEGLRGKAETKGDNLIRVFNVFDYISKNVPNQAAQHPIFKASDLENNFPIALYLGRKQVGASPPPPTTSVNKTVLRESIVKHFSIEDLEILCADIEQTMANDGLNLQVDLEIVGGVSKSAKVLKLIEYLDRRGFLSYLVDAIRKAHPGIM